MELPFNDWSFPKENDISLSKKEWCNFVLFVKLLSTKYGIQKVLMLKEHLRLMYSFNPLEKEKVVWSTFVNKYLKRIEIEKNLEGIICNKDRKDFSNLLTIAFYRKVPTISLTYKKDYKTDWVEAELCTWKTEKYKSVKLPNLFYDNSTNHYSKLIIDKPDRNIKPLECPIWNIERTKEYVNSLSELEKMSPNERIVHLLEEGKWVAMMNGWLEDESLSKLNSNSGQIRSIFYPAYFKHSNSAFLSIDLEKRAFELLDHNGKHLGEYSYMGEKQEGYKEYHNIKLRR